jgi:hypothetical protein
MKAILVRRLRSLLIAVLFLFSFATVTAPKYADAQTTRSGHEFDYYSDSTYTTLVGVAIFCNSGQTFRWGTTTPYSIISDSGC